MVLSSLCCALLRPPNDESAGAVCVLKGQREEEGAMVAHVRVHGLGGTVRQYGSGALAVHFWLQERERERERERARERERGRDTENVCPCVEIASESECTTWTLMISYFGATRTQGYKVTNGVGVIQGDGISVVELERILEVIQLERSCHRYWRKADR